MSMEAVLDIADQQEPPPDPKAMETQQKVQAKQAESQIKLQTKQAESQIKLQTKQEESQLKLQGMQEKLQAHQMKKRNGFDPQQTEDGGGNHQIGSRTI